MWATECCVDIGFLSKVIYSFICLLILCMCEPEWIAVHHEPEEPEEAEMGIRSGTGVYRWLGVPMWVLGTTHVFSARAATAFNL